MVQLYADSRGVFRIYRMTLTESEWRLERAAPDFHQRFVGVFRDDGRTIDGRWESSPDGTTWELDFPITYRKVAEAQRTDEFRPPTAVRSVSEPTRTRQESDHDHHDRADDAARSRCPAQP